MSQWRVLLDVPYVFTSEPAYARSVDRTRFHPVEDSYHNTWRCPETGIVMLRPNAMTDQIIYDLEPLESIRKKDDHWQSVKRGHPQASLLGSTRRVGSDPNDIEITIDAAIKGIEEYVSRADTLKWALETKFTLERDQGWMFMCEPIFDQMMRKRNLYYFQWDNIGIHLSQTGEATCFLYDRGNLAAGGMPYHQFQFAEPGDVRSLMCFVFLPIPGVGLMFYHRHLQPSMTVAASGGRWTVAHAHKIVHPSYQNANGITQMFEASTVRVAVNPFRDASTGHGYHHVIGVGRVKFSPTTGTYTDSVNSQIATPTVPMDAPRVVTLPTFAGAGATVELRDWKNPASSYVTGDAEYRVRVTLTGTQEWTPFLMGYGVSKPPVMTTRTSTPLVLSRQACAGDTMLGLEWSHDSKDRYEGTLECLMASGQARAIAERGDTTYVVQVRETDADPWETLFGGITQKPDLKVMGGPYGWCYRARWTLMDMWERFAEYRNLYSPHLDDLMFSDAINNYLYLMGWPNLDPVPAEARQKRLPPVNAAHEWQFAPREGDTPQETINVLLLLLSSQFVQWKMRYDWDGGRWYLEKRRRSLTPTPWQLVPYSAAESVPLRRLAYNEDPETLDLYPEPPEANTIRMLAATSQDVNAERHEYCMWNNYSMNYPLNKSYLGRGVFANYLISPVEDSLEVAMMCRRIFDMVAFRRMKGRIRLSRFNRDILPDDPVQVLDLSGNPVPTVEPRGRDGEEDVLWVKRRIVRVEMDDKEEETLEIDSLWEHDA